MGALHKDTRFNTLARMLGDDFAVPGAPRNMEKGEVEMPALPQQAVKKKCKGSGKRAC